MNPKELLEARKRILVGGVTEVQILGERACGGITGDIAIHDGKVIITFLKYVEMQSDGKWVRMDNHPMDFSAKKCEWIDGNLLIRDGNTIVVVHQSLEALSKR